MDKSTQGRLEAAVEALIFASDVPVAASRIVAVIGEVMAEPAPDADAITQAVESLNARYDAQGHVLRIRHWAGGYRMTTTAEMAPLLEVFLRRERRRKLTLPLMETLAILCYRQPASRPDVSHVRGVDADYALRKLLDIGLVDVVGRSEAVGRPLLYGTTQRFLEEFGLPDLDALPNLRGIEELLSDPSFSQEKARLFMLQGLSGATEAEQP